MPTNALNGRRFTQQELDNAHHLQQAVIDRVLTPIGTRAAIPDYGSLAGFSIQGTPEMQASIEAALRGMLTVTSVSSTLDNRALTVDVRAPGNKRVIMTFHAYAPEYTEEYR